MKGRIQTETFFAADEKKESPLKKEMCESFLEKIKKKIFFEKWILKETLL